jgi:GT2 family glycosyltransferase
MIVHISTAKIAIVTINYNGMDDTVRLLKSIDAAREKVAVVVVDNCSKIRPNRLKEEFTKIELVLSQFNGGFGYGNNLGVKHIIKNPNNIEYIFILNNDTEISDGCLSELEIVLARRDIICAAPLIVYPDQKTIWFGGGGFSMKNAGAYSLYKDKPRFLLSAQPDIYESPFISGCAMFMRIADYIRIGGFDERYFMYFEDIDLCYRLHKNGRLVLVKNAVVTHYAHSTLGDDVAPLSNKNPNLEFYVSNVVKGTKLFINSNFKGYKKYILKLMFFIKWQRNGIRLGLKGWLMVNGYIMSNFR